jgi:hypothetical protein
VTLVGGAGLFFGAAAGYLCGRFSARRERLRRGLEVDHD